jgi:Zn-dependent oligopeptidase
VVATGQRFRDTVLSLGGSVAPADVFKVSGEERERSLHTHRETLNGRPR